MKKKSFLDFLIFTVFLFCCTVDVRSQSAVIRGTIKNETGSALENASVQIKGSASGVVTNALGAFELSGKNGDVLVASAIGYQPVEVVYNGSPLNILLKVQTADLDQVVVVGYSRQKKVNLTGAVSVVSGQELAKRPVFNTTVALQGALPGVTGYAWKQ
jgi:hypothetical protein